MNWTAAILIVVFFWIPMLCVIYSYIRGVVKIDKGYQARCKEIDERYGVEE